MHKSAKADLFAPRDKRNGPHVVRPVFYLRLPMAA